MIFLKTDWIARWFSTYQQSGEFIGVRFAKIAPGSSQPEWFYKPHNQSDAIGSFTDLLEKERYTKIDSFELKNKEFPSWWGIFKSWIFYLRSLKIKSPRWKNFKKHSLQKALHTSPQALAWKVFTKEETNQIQKNAVREGGSLNSYLLNRLTHVLSAEFQDEKASVWWVLPVNMRGGIQMPSILVNGASMMDIETKPQESAYETHERIKKNFKHNIHWGTWYALSFSAMLGQCARRVILKIQSRSSSQRIGTFSNIGSWDPDPPHGFESSDWIFCPTVFQNQLLGVGCLLFRGKLSLAIQIHPTLTEDPRISSRWLADWGRELLMGGYKLQSYDGSDEGNDKNNS